jgi:hypothetical protein
MNKYLLVIARYKDERQEIFEKYISPKNEDYCLRHGMEYLLVDNSVEFEDFTRHPSWMKFYLDKKYIQEGRFKEDDLIVHFDADMVITKPEFEYTTSRSFSYAIDNGNTHCMGNYCIRVNEWSTSLVENILDEKFFQENKDNERWKSFWEQAAWYSLAGIVEHSWKPFFEIPYYGFLSDPKEATKYSVADLMKHVEIKDSRWNTTLLSEEVDNPFSLALEQYNINKTPAKETIIRHFAGGQPWRNEYF